MRKFTEFLGPYLRNVFVAVSHFTNVMTPGIAQRTVLLFSSHNKPKPIGCMRARDSPRLRNKTKSRRVLITEIAEASTTAGRLSIDRTIKTGSSDSCVNLMSE
uniref:Secreted protein n=1 Tax=Steinernema glaseri TaxID=37863 RepID=A0A1I7ZPA5_9BILA